MVWNLVPVCWKLGLHAAGVGTGLAPATSSTEPPGEAGVCTEHDGLQGLALQPAWHCSLPGCLQPQEPMYTQGTSNGTCSPGPLWEVRDSLHVWEYRDI